jgi:hypothetical protein
MCYYIDTIILYNSTVNRISIMSNMEEVPKTSIQIETDTRDKLREKGRKGDSYDDIIIWLLKIAKDQKR